MNYTKGPWMIKRKSWPMTVTGRVHQVTDKEGYPSAFVPAWDDPKEGEVDGSEEAIANAILISAAPDLLDALKYARRFLNPADHDVSYVDYVIDKATGHTAATAKAEVL